MLRGEIRLVDLDPGDRRGGRPAAPRGGREQRRANAVAARLGRDVVTVVPVISNVTRVYPFQALLVPGSTGLHVEPKAQAEQVRSVSVERLGPALGRLPATAMSELDKALRLHLIL